MNDILALRGFRSSMYNGSAKLPSRLLCGFACLPFGEVVWGFAFGG